MDALLRRRAMIADGGGTPPVPGLVFHNSLIFDGVAYIDTDLIIPENGSVLFPAGYEAEKKAQVLFNVGGRVYANLNSSTNSTTRYFLASYDGGSAASGTTLGLNWSFNTYAFFITPKRVGIGANSNTFTKGGNRPTDGMVVGQNFAHTGTPYTGALRNALLIYGSDAQDCASYSDFSSFTPVYTIRPCTYMGENGLWCVETSTFYGNSAGAGQLTVAD